MEFFPEQQIIPEIGAVADSIVIAETTVGGLQVAGKRFVIAVAAIARFLVTGGRSDLERMKGVDIDIGGYIKALTVVEIIAGRLLIIEIRRIGQEILTLYFAFLVRIVMVVKIVAGKLCFSADDVTVVNAAGPDSLDAVTVAAARHCSDGVI